MPPTSNNPTDWGAAEIARRIARGEVSSAQVVEAHIARIEAVDGRLNAVVVRRFDEARAEAAAADAGQAGGEALGPLHGVPITVKECFQVAGTPATIGLPSRQGELASEDGLPVRRLRAAGAILLGKTNLPQLMVWHECDNPVYGRTNNPWNLTRTPGGSTGGEAAIVAARGSPLGIGNDLGGSIRVPAHFCGIHGLKPTSLRLPRAGAVSTLRGFEAIVTQPGPMARHVEDLWLALRILADPSDGYLAGDVVPGSLPDPATVDLSKLRIGVLTHDGVFPASTGARRAVREAASALGGLGAELVELNDSRAAHPLTSGEFFDIYVGLVGADGGADGPRLSAGNRLDWRVRRLMAIAALRPLARKSLASGLRIAGQAWMTRLVATARPLSADAYRQLAHRKHQFVRAAIDRLQRDRIDAILAPPHALPAPQHGKGIDLIAAASYSMLFNLLGFPAGVVSTTRVRPGEDQGRPPARDQVLRQAAAVDRGSVGLPLGVQVAALPWREEKVLAVMKSLESHFASLPDYPGWTPGLLTDLPESVSGR
ncbi:MAG: amidase family protein [Pirellulaceae bacterium]